MPIPLGILAVAGAGAAGLSNDFDWLESTVLGSNTASVTFSNLNNYSAYKHLQIRATTRESSSTIGANLLVRFNSDTGNNYANHRIRGNGTNVASDAGTSRSSIILYEMPRSADTANLFGASVIDILDFSSSSKNTTIRTANGTTHAELQINLTSGLWNNTAAVTSITLLSSATGFATGSRFSLYGIR